MPSHAEVVVTGSDATGSRVLAEVAALQGRAAVGGTIRGPVTANRSGRRDHPRAVTAIAICDPR